MAYDKNYWNNKWPQAPVIYGGRVLRTDKEVIALDVRNFITINDNILEEVIRKYRLNRGSMNKRAHAIQKFVVKFLTYKYDNESQDCPEFWQFPFETLHTKIGDCEDGAILIAALCRVAGIPDWRVKVAAGYVQSAPTAPQGGHGYAIYLADRPDTDRGLEWVVLDWCIADNSKTLIQTPDGGKRISKLKNGDWIIGYDEENKKPALTQVKKIGNRKTKDLYTVTFKNGHKIYATGEHPFMVEDEWVRTDKLKPGQEVYWITPKELFHSFHNHKKDPWRKKAAIKTARKNKENGVYKALNERQKKNNVFTWPEVRKKLSKNNCMKRPDIARKSFSTRTNGQLTTPELLFLNYCIENKLPIKFVGDGKMWIKDEDGSICPDFKIPNTNKVIEVSSPKFEYYRNWDEYKIDRKKKLEKHGLKVEFVLLDKKGITKETDIKKLHSFILNGNSVVKIEKTNKTNLTLKNKEWTVWNMHCSPYNNYFVNGNLVHNCYYEDSKLTCEQKALAKNGGFNSCYKETWFTFNDQSSWNQKSLKIGRGRVRSTKETLEQEDLLEKVMVGIAERVDE